MTSPHQNASGATWRVGAQPAALLRVGVAFRDFAASLRALTNRPIRHNDDVVYRLVHLSQAAESLANSLDYVGRQLDAADLARRLAQYSIGVRRQMRSRSLLYPSSQARRLGLGEDRQFLRVRAKGHGQVVEVFGNLATAQHIAIIVPGMTNKLGDYDPNTRDKGVHLAAAMHAYDPRTAVVAWLGYRTPDLSAAGLVEAAHSDRAQVGAQQLVDDLEVLRRMAPRAHFTIVSHSYGTVVAAETLRSKGLSRRLDHVNVGDVVALASPGMNVDSRPALGHKRVEVWTSKAPWKKGRVKVNPLAVLLAATPIGVSSRPIVGNPVDIALPHPVDWIPYAPTHGPDPADDDFGAKPFSTKGAISHSTYFELGTTSLENLARIATDRPVIPG